MSISFTPLSPSTSQPDNISGSDGPTPQIPPGPSTSRIDRDSLLGNGSWAGDDELSVCTVDEPIDPSKCYLLKHLPIELRKQIYCELFYRPVTIIPRDIPIRYNILKAYKYGGNVQRDLRNTSRRFIYRYCWDDVREERPGKDTGVGGSSDWTTIVPRTVFYSQPPVDVRKTWISNATEEDIKWCDENDTADLPDVVNGEKHITRHIHYRPHFSDQAINEKFIHVTSLQGLELLRTCKKTYEEATDVLYGENRFCFNLGGERWDGDTIHRQRELNDETPSRIPGLSNEDGMPSSTQDLSRALRRLFAKRYQPDFNYRDPLLRFFFQIGHHNASKLTNIKIKGILGPTFKTIQSKDKNSAPFYFPMGLVDLLPVYTATLGSVCTKLRKLDLSIFVRKPEAVRSHCIVDADEETIYLTVEKVVRGLPSLTELYLGHTYPHGFYDRYRDDWKRSAKWMNFVRERSPVPEEDLEEAAAKLGLHRVKVHRPRKPFKGEKLELYMEKKCFFCKVEGHFERNCPERKKKFKRSKKPKKFSEKAAIGEAGESQGTRGIVRRGRGGRGAGRGRARGNGFTGRGEGQNGSNENATTGEGGDVGDRGGSGSTCGEGRRGRGGRGGRARGRSTHTQSD